MDNWRDVHRGGRLGAHGRFGCVDFGCAKSKNAPSWLYFGPFTALRVVIFGGGVEHAGGGGDDPGLCAIGPKPKYFCQ